MFYFGQQRTYLTIGWLVISCYSYTDHSQPNSGSCGIVIALNKLYNSSNAINTPCDTSWLCDWSLMQSNWGRCISRAPIFRDIEAFVCVKTRWRISDRCDLANDDLYIIWSLVSELTVQSEVRSQATHTFVSLSLVFVVVYRCSFTRDESRQVLIFL